MASGLTLVFGLMDVMNFAHGAFITVGAYAAASVLVAMKADMQAPSLAANLRRSCRRCAAAMVLAGVAWPVLRARGHPPGVRRSPEADPGHDGRADRGRAADPRGVGPGHHPAAAAGDHHRLGADRRCRDRALSHAGRGGRAGGVRRDVADPRPHPARAADPRRGREHRDGRVARLPHPAPVRRRVRRRLGARRPGRRDVGDVPGVGQRGDGHAGHGGDLHRHHHRRAGLGRRLLRRRAARRPAGQLHRLRRAEARARLEHPADGADPAVAAARAVSGGQT